MGGGVALMVVLRRQIWQCKRYRMISLTRSAHAHTLHVDIYREMIGMAVRMYVLHMCICAYIYIYIYTHINVYTHICIYVYMYIDMYTYIYIYTYGMVGYGMR